MQFVPVPVDFKRAIHNYEMVFNYLVQLSSLVKKCDQCSIFRDLGKMPPVGDLIKSTF